MFLGRWIGIEVGEGVNCVVVVDVKDLGEVGRKDWEDLDGGGGRRYWRNGIGSWLMGIYVGYVGKVNGQGREDCRGSNFPHVVGIKLGRTGYIL